MFLGKSHLHIVQADSWMLVFQPCVPLRVRMGRVWVQIYAIVQAPGTMASSAMRVGKDNAARSTT